MRSPTGTCTVRKSKDDSCDYRGGMEHMGYIADKKGTKMRFGRLIYDIRLNVNEDERGKFMIGPVTLVDFIEEK